VSTFEPSLVSWLSSLNPPDQQKLFEFLDVGSWMNNEPAPTDTDIETACKTGENSLP
jgi:hypothetical protein